MALAADHKRRRRPFEGLRMLDFSHVVTGPYCSRLLATLGAEVIKVEKPVTGDGMRLLPPLVGAGDSQISNYFAFLNIGKKSIGLDFRRPQAIAIARALARQSDIVLENYRPGVMARLGLDYKSLSQDNPRLIMCSISGFGQQGPYLKRPGQDTVAQSIAGTFTVTGDETAPVLPLLSPADLIGGVHAFDAICAALYFREESGRGQYIDISQTDSILTMHDTAVQHYLLTDGKAVQDRRGRHHPYLVPRGIFEAKHGYLAIEAVASEAWRRLATVIGRPELGTDPDFAAPAARGERREMVIEVVQQWAYRFGTAAEAVALLLEAGVPAAPVVAIDEIVHDPHLLSRGMLVDIEQPGVGPLAHMNTPFVASGVNVGLHGYAPRRGEHNLEVLTTLLDFSPQQVATLLVEGVLDAEDGVAAGIYARLP